MQKKKITYGKPETATKLSATKNTQRFSVFNKTHKILFKNYKEEDATKMFPTCQE